MKHFLVILLLFPQTKALAQASLESSIYSEAEITRYRRKVHPSKLGYCLGRDTEISDNTLKNIISQNGLSGGVTRRESGGNSQIGEFYFGNLNWNFEMDPSETLKIHFSQSTTGNAEETTQMLCNTTLTKSTVLNSSTKWTGSVLLTVPQNVFVLRINQIQLANSESDTNIKTKLSIINRDPGANDNSANEENNIFPIGASKIKYHFVRPGDLVRLAVEYKTDALRDVRFDASFEVGFLGSFRCHNSQFNMANPMFGTDLLRLFKNAPQNNKQLDNLLVKASCLQNPLFSRELLLNSHGSALSNLLRSIENQLRTEIAPGTVDGDLNYFYRRALSYLSLDLSKNVISDLSLFCDTAKLNTIFKIPTEFEVLTRKYHWASLNFIKIKYTLDQATPPAVDAILQILQQKAQNHEAYISLRDPQTLDLLRTYIQDALADRVTNYSNIVKILEEFPDTMTGRNSQKTFLNKVREAHRLALDFQYQIQLQMRRIGTSSPDIVNVKDLPDRWIEIKKLNTELQQDLQKNLQWFEVFDDNPASSQFVKDMYDLNSIILQKSIYLESAAKKDRELYKALVEHHAEYEPLLNLHKNRELNQRINKCLDSAHD